MSFAGVQIYNRCQTQPHIPAAKTAPFTSKEKATLILDIFLTAALATVGILALLAANGINLGAINSIGSLGLPGAYAFIGVAGAIVIADVIALSLRICCRKNKRSGGGTGEDSNENGIPLNTFNGPNNFGQVQESSFENNKNGENDLFSFEPNNFNNSPFENNFPNNFSFENNPPNNFSFDPPNQSSFTLNNNFSSNAPTPPPPPTNDMKFSRLPTSIDSSSKNTIDPKKTSSKTKGAGKDMLGELQSKLNNRKSLNPNDKTPYIDPQMPTTNPTQHKEYRVAQHVLGKNQVDKSRLKKTQGVTPKSTVNVPNQGTDHRHVLKKSTEKRTSQENK